MKLTRKQVYLKAAERIAIGREEFSCNAVKWLSDRATSDRYRVAMGFLPHSDYNMVDEFLDAVYAAAGNTMEEAPQRRNFRVLLLCLMAAADGDLD